MGEKLVQALSLSGNAHLRQLAADANKHIRQLTAAAANARIARIREHKNALAAQEQE